VLQTCHKGVTIVLQGCHKGVARVLQVCYRNGTGVLPGTTCQQQVGEYCPYHQTLAIEFDLWSFHVDANV
jgi:hypothetical protein